MDYTKVDVHAHFMCPAYREALEEHCQGKLLSIPQWSVADHLKFMQDNKISKSILSILSPGAHFLPRGHRLARQLSRSVNEYAAQIKRNHPKKFGFWASLPLPDIEGSLKEIEYALDVLDADGFVFLSNHDGMYLGDPRLAPILNKLDQRGAIVFVHPTAPCNHPPTETSSSVIRSQGNSCNTHIVSRYMMPTLEPTFDATRSIVDLILSGNATYYPQIRWMVTHCGLALPSVLNTVAEHSQFNPEGIAGRKIQRFSRDELKKLLSKQFYFDLAGNCVPHQLQNLLMWINPTRLLYGSDVPCTSTASANRLSQQFCAFISKFYGLGQDHLKPILQENAERLFARKTRLEKIKGRSFDLDSLTMEEIEIFHIRLRLQRAFLGPQQSAERDVFHKISNLVTVLEKTLERDDSMAEAFKIHKVLKLIIRLKSIPGDCRYKFRRRFLRILQRLEYDP